MQEFPLSHLLCESDAFLDASTAFVCLGKEILSRGEEITVRGQRTKELLNIAFTVLHPTNRCMFLPFRNDNIFAKIAETLWVLTGHNDIRFLSYYLPRASEFSDNGRTWRGGYGPRLRTWSGANRTVDQILQCTSLLQSDPNSRRAVMILFDPSEDYVSSKDIPCNNWLHWTIRDRRLNLAVAQRSSDLYWGYSGINAFEWSMLQQMMAYWLHVEVGTMTYFISSLHLYERHWKRMQKIVDSQQRLMLNPYDGVVSEMPFHTSYDLSLHFMNTVVNRATSLRNNRPCEDSELTDPLMYACWLMLKMWHVYKAFSDSPDEAAMLLSDWIREMPTCDFRLAALEYFHRSLKIEIPTVIEARIIRSLDEATERGL